MDKPWLLPLISAIEEHWACIMEGYDDPDEAEGVYQWLRDQEGMGRP